MGLSGAEDDEQNARFVEYLKTAHGDIAEHFYLASDAVATVAANFEQGTNVCFINPEKWLTVVAILFSEK